MHGQRRGMNGWVALGWVTLITLPMAAQDFATRFSDPPAEARIHKIIHGWPDSPEAQDQLIERLKSQGFGGVVCNIAFDQYLESEPKWQAFVRAVHAAKAAGFALWLYDERGYPSGNAGGITLRDHPEWEARGLLVADKVFDGGEGVIDLPPGQLRLAAAYPERDGVLDLAGKVDLAAKISDGKLRWQAPAGRWHGFVVTEHRLYEGTHADGNLWAKIPYVNLLMAEPTARFLEVTHDAYARRLGADLGKYFLGTFTDEPSLMSWFLKPMPYRPLPWAPAVAEAFRSRRGYALETDTIPALVADAGPSTQRLRHDFWLTIGELVSENFFGQIQTRCRQYRVPSGGHLLMEESLAAHVALYGDFFRCVRRLDAPSIDCLTSLPPEVPWHIARLLASAAELEGHPLVMSETSDHGQHYRGPGDTRPRRTVTEAEIRGTCNRLIVSGVNDITSYYSFEGLADDALRRLNAWVGRCCTAVRGGYQSADVALVYPAESTWVRFIPSRYGTREASAANRIESLYLAAANSLFTAPRDFTLVDSRALAEAKVEAGGLRHGQLRWRVVVLPGADTLPQAAWENLGRFIEQGGVLVALGNLPANDERRFPSAKVQGLAREWFGLGTGEAAAEPQARVNPRGGAAYFLPPGSEGLLPLVLDGVLEPAVRVSGVRAPIRATRRHLENRAVYFVINDSAEPWVGELAFAAQGDGERWDPATGQRAEALTGSTVRLSLEGYGAALFRFATAREPRRFEPVEGALPGLSLRPVRRVEPTVARGEFVQAELSPAPGGDGAQGREWQAKATLTKSNVDTFLFVQFHYGEPLDLGEADGLAFTTKVPPGQSTPSQVLLIVHEEGGGDFVASTGRPLSAPGMERSFIPVDRLELAAWSRDRDPDGRLDLHRVSDIRIGWGGYLGTAGEQVQFSVTLPEVVRARRGPAGSNDRR